MIIVDNENQQEKADSEEVPDDESPQSVPEVLLRFNWCPKDKKISSAKPGQPGCGSVEMEVDIEPLNLKSPGDDSTMAHARDLFLYTVERDVGRDTMLTITPEWTTLVASKPGKKAQSILTGAVLLRMLLAPGVTIFTLSGTCVGQLVRIRNVDTLLQEMLYVGDLLAYWWRSTGFTASLAVAPAVVKEQAPQEPDPQKAKLMEIKIKQAEQKLLSDKKKQQEKDDEKAHKTKEEVRMRVQLELTRLIRKEFGVSEMTGAMVGKIAEAMRRKLSTNPHAAEKAVGSLGPENVHLTLGTCGNLQHTFESA